MSDDTDAFLREVARVSDRTPPEVALSRIGEQIGRFRLTGELGRGGMGVVYAARDTGLGREVALKVLTAQHNDDTEQRARLMREARAAAAIEHPNVARMFEVGEQDGELFIVMERIDGPSLRARLGEQALSAEQALAIIRSIALALGAAHRVGVVHRDMKPDNVMFDAAGQLKLLDFGLAKRLPQSASGEHDDTFLTKVGSLLGTPSYMSPEQAAGQPVSARSDVFSLGVMAYELLTGARPFDRPTRVATVNALSHEQPPPIDTRRLKVSGDYALLVARMLEKLPEDRFADGDAVVAAMDACARKRPAIARWSAAAMLVLLAGGMLALLTRGAARPTSTREPAAAEAHAHKDSGETSVAGEPALPTPGRSAPLSGDTPANGAPLTNPSAQLRGDTATDSVPSADSDPTAAPSPHTTAPAPPRLAATPRSAAPTATSPAPSKPAAAPSPKPPAPVDDDDFGF